MKIQAVDFRSHQRNTLRGFCTLALGSSGLLVHDCCLHCKGGQWWVSFPARSYEGRDGVQQWKPLLEFGDPSSKARFQEQALAALRERFPAIFEAAAA
jgi:hypothetical protein